jgi:PAS domain S-box-containing protein
VNDSTLIRRDEKGGITHYQGILFDITDHKLTGDVLRESEEKLRKIFDGASDGILIAEPGTKRILQGNSAICSMLGYTKEEIESLTIHDIHPRNDISHVLDEFEKQFRGEKNFAEDVPLLKKDGSIIYADISSVGIAIGGKRSLVGIFRDITDHKKSQAALRESEARYRTLIETSRDLIYTTDRAGCLTYINPTLERFLGYERDELKGKPFTQMTVPEFSDTARDIFKRSMKGEQIPIYEAEFVRKDGTKVSVEINTTTLFDAEGKPSGRYGIGRDITERKKAEKERREYELRLASIIDFLPDATLVIDKGGKVIAWNRAIEQMTNVPAREMLGKGNHEYALPFYGERRPILIDLVLHPDREVQKKYSRIERKDLILYGENCIRNFRGGEVYLIGTASALRDSEGTVVGAIESIRDITERRTTEVMLRQSEERYKELFENMSSGVAVYEATEGGQDFIFRQFNKAGERIDNIKREELLGKKVTTVFPAIAEMGLLNVFQRVWRTGNPEHFPACVYDDGRISGWRENYVYRLPSGEIVAVYDDVTSRSMAEESLRKSEEKYRSIFENAQEGIYQATMEGSFITVNPALAQMTGYASPDEMMGEIRNIRRDLHLRPDDRARLIDIMEKEGFVSRFETTWKKKDGSVISVILNARAKKDDKGNIRYYDGTVVDVTGHKRLESQLLQAQKMEAVGTLAGGIAHDFNNLLMTMQGNTSMMLEELDPAHPHNEYLKSIESQIRSAANLTRQLLGFAREGRYDIKSMDINDVIEKAALIFGRTKKEIQIHRTYEKDLWLVEVDEDQMGQVFMNLFVNAWQAMPGGGDLFLQTSNVVLDEEYVVPYTLIPGEYVKVSITDTGVGMDEKTILRIFEPFFTTKERGKGTGLGLSMVYGIVKGHKGFINVYSKPGRGATFNIYLPASTKEVGPKASVSSGVIRGSGTILLIDDEANVLRVVQRMLDHLGYRTVTAQSGKEAVDLYEMRKEEIDLVLLDMIMPEMSGERVFQILREMNPRIRVVLLSGYSINGHAKKIIDQGCRGFLQKPVSLAGLSQKINEVLVMKDEE